MKSICFCILSTALLSTQILHAADATSEPVYFYLYARVTDHINVDITEDQLHRLLPMIEKLRKMHPEAHVSATVLFSGAVSEALAQRNRQTHILDFVKGYIDRGTIQAGYDGTDEPTYETRPAVDFTENSDPQRRWVERQAGEEKFLTEGRNPVTGALEPGKAGGLKEMQEVFGPAVCITGVNTLMRLGPGALPHQVTRARVLNEAPKPVVLPSGLMPEVGGDSESVEVIRAFNSQAIMFGVPDTNPARIPGFREGRAGFGRLISPDRETPPELYWQDNVLRSS